MQYMPKKPNKLGLKAYSLADSKTGYTITGVCMQVNLFYDNYINR